MGGYGSGYRGMKKQVVEKCLVLSVNCLARKGLIKQTRWLCRLTWTRVRTKEEVATAGYECTQNDGVWFFNLYYCINGSQDVHLPIPLEQVKIFTKQKRWHFHCPSCGKRTSKLYLPPDGIHFLCRDCHALTYLSCQESHAHDRILHDLMKRNGWESIPKLSNIKKYVY